MPHIMIGVFDSGHGGLTVLRALVDRFPQHAFMYLGDHARVPYGNRPSDEVVALTRAGVEMLFERGCTLVILGCNTATCVAARTLQQDWLPGSRWRGHNVLGIVAPTVEAATQTPWAITTPQYPQKYNSDTIAVLGTMRTITSNAYVEEIRKRCPNVTVIQHACADLAGAIERGEPEAELTRQVKAALNDFAARANGRRIDRVILACTHYPLVEHLFRRHLDPGVRLLSQPAVVADSLEDYLARHPQYVSVGAGAPVLLTTGKIADINHVKRVFWPDAPPFRDAQF